MTEKKMPYREHADELRRLKEEHEPVYGAIHFLDGWTGTAYFEGQVFLCMPKAMHDRKRHPTEAEAIACIRGAYEPGTLSVAEKYRRAVRKAKP